MVATFNKTIRKHIFLHPTDKKRRHAAVKAALLKDKRKYSDKLEGALLDVNRLKVVGERHLVVEGYSSLDVEADCVVFTPKPGDRLEAKVNKLSYSHLGCLVLDVFNAALKLPPQGAQLPQVGDTVTFIVTEVIIDGQILFMRGRLDGDYSTEPEPNSIEGAADDDSGGAEDAAVADLLDVKLGAFSTATPIPTPSRKPGKLNESNLTSQDESLSLPSTPATTKVSSAKRSKLKLNSSTAQEKSSTPSAPKATTPSGKHSKPELTASTAQDKTLSSSSTSTPVAPKVKVKSEPLSADEETPSKSKKLKLNKIKREKL